MLGNGVILCLQWHFIAPNSTQFEIFIPQLFHTVLCLYPNVQYSYIIHPQLYRLRISYSSECVSVSLDSQQYNTVTGRGHNNCMMQANWLSMCGVRCCWLAVKAAMSTMSAWSLHVCNCHSKRYRTKTQVILSSISLSYPQPGYLQCKFSHSQL